MTEDQTDAGIPTPVTLTDPAAATTAVVDRIDATLGAVTHDLTATPVTPVTPVTPDQEAVTLTDEQTDEQVTAPPTGRHRSPGHPVTPDRTTGQTAIEPLSRKVRAFVNLCVWGLYLITMTIAATGLVSYAQSAGILDIRKFGVPAGLDLAANALVLLGYVRARYGNSPWPLWTPALAIGALGAYLNYDHSVPHKAGAIFGTMSLVSLLLIFVKLGLDYRRYLADSDKAGLGVLWIQNRRLAFRVWLLRPRLRVVEKTSVLIGFAELWIAVFDDAAVPPADAKPAWNAPSRRLRSRTAWRTVLVAAGSPIADLPASAVIQRVRVIDRPTPTAPVTPAGQVAVTEQTEDLPVYVPPAWEAEVAQQTARPVTPTGQVSAERRPAPRPPARPEPVSAPPAGDGSPVDRWVRLYADAITSVQQYVDQAAGVPGTWKTRATPITDGEIAQATGIGGKPTRRRIRYVIESMSDRGAPTGPLPN